MNNTLDDHVRAYEGDLQYDFDNQILLNWYPQRILGFTDKSSSLLELGLGHGYTTSFFSEHFSKHLVLEGSNAVIDNFRKKFPKCTSEIKQVFFEEFSGDEKFDVIVMGFILEHVDSPGEILTHFKKFLNKGGKIFVAVPNAEVLNRRIGHLAGMLQDMQALSENDFMLGHKRYYTVKSLTHDINLAGFEIERLEGIYLKPFTTQQIISLNFDKSVINALCKVGIGYPELSCGILAQIKVGQ